MNDPDLEATDRDFRIRSLTIKGHSLYTQKTLDLKERFQKAWRDIEDIIASFNNDSTDPTYVRSYQNKMLSADKVLFAHSDELVNYLTV